LRDAAIQEPVSGAALDLDRDDTGGQVSPPNRPARVVPTGVMQAPPRTPEMVHVGISHYFELAMFRSQSLNAKKD
jgi:hypothetical protein